MRFFNDILYRGENRAGAKSHRRKHDEVAGLEAERIEGQGLELYPALVAIDAQDEVDRVELGVGGQHTRLAWQSVQYRAQALAGARLGNNAVGTGRSYQLRNQGPEAFTALYPQIPGSVHLAVPGVDCRAQLLGDVVGWAAKQVVREVNLLSRQHPKKARPHVPRATPHPISVRTSMSSGK